jgi:RNA polymerase sigma-70 factor, ECF subfamily
VIRQIPTKENLAQETAENALLVNRARHGDKEAFRLLYEKYYRSIYNLIYRMVGRREEAADLTGEVFLRALQGLKNLKTDEAFGGWLRRVAMNLCLDAAKRKKLPTMSLDATSIQADGSERQPLEVPDTGRGPELEAMTEELSERVHHALAHLSPDHRAVILLHHLDGRDVKEIAQIMGCSEGTVKSRLGRAREHMRKLLEGYVKEPDEE